MIRVMKGCVLGIFVLLVVAHQPGTAQRGMQYLFAPTLGPLMSRLMDRGRLGESSFSFLDPAKFSMRERMVWEFSSAGGSGNLVGMYLNSMEYRVAEPLKIRLTLGYNLGSHALYGQRDQLGGIGNQVFIPSADVIWEPTKNTRIIFSYRQFVPSYHSMYPYSRYNRFYQY